MSATRRADSTPRLKGKLFGCDTSNGARDDHLRAASSETFTTTPLNCKTLSSTGRGRHPDRAVEGRGAGAATRSFTPTTGTNSRSQLVTDAQRRTKASPSPVAAARPRQRVVPGRVGLERQRLHDVHPHAG